MKIGDTAIHPGKAVFLRAAALLGSRKAMKTAADSAKEKSLFFNGGKTAAEMLPNLILIGAKKCATTSLHYYLSLHPDIFMSAHKELNFFVEELNWRKGLRWYEKQFPVPAIIRGESSPNYTQYPVFRGVAKRIHAVIPQARLIYMVRDPVEQLVSAYLQDVKAGIETRTLDEIIKSESKQSPYVEGACYHFQLKRFLEYYSLPQILVLAAEDLKKNPDETMARVFKFLGVDAGFRSEEFHSQKNVAGENVTQKQSKLERLAHDREGHWLGHAAAVLTPVYLKFRKRKAVPLQRDVPEFVPSPELKQSLRVYFEADIHALRELTGKKLQDWSV